MNDSFLAQPAEVRADAYAAAAESLGHAETAIEKDVWVCWTLDVLFGCPNMPNMAFKGGTSLSKAFDAISRFSEDIDITMHFPDHGDPYTEGLSRKKRDAMDLGLANAMKAISTETFVPYLKTCAEESGATVRVEGGGEVVWVDYPSALDQRHGYFTEGVKIEFGGRAGVDPSETQALRPYIAEEFPQFTYPSPTANVLAPTRTFWEKYTLAHAESTRDNFKSPERFSRHWYDLYVLADHPIGRDALEDRELLAQVIKMKKRFFAAGGVDYDHCLNGKAVLLPANPTLASALEDDYNEMVASGMLNLAQPPAYATIAERIQQLQDQVNSLTTA